NRVTSAMSVGRAVRAAAISSASASLRFPSAISATGRTPYRRSPYSSKQLAAARTEGLSTPSRSRPSPPGPAVPRPHSALSASRSNGSAGPVAATPSGANSCWGSSGTATLRRNLVADLQVAVLVQPALEPAQLDRWLGEAALGGTVDGTVE